MGWKLQKASLKQESSDAALQPAVTAVADAPPPRRMRLYGSHAAFLRYWGRRTWPLAALSRNAAYKDMTVEVAHSFARFWRQISSFSRYFLETLTETGCIHWVGIQTSAKGQGVGSLFLSCFFLHNMTTNMTQTNFLRKKILLRKIFFYANFF